ncbi:hypothetical protein Bpfe_001371 [Biomphalaria pfeifferi]|uniref:Ig-like domain-containing protein n=1 Tax=Biomphalaria pfeifferi TaxID=112525 RepID=A0AAD8CBE2_BIOPF|nr:hypothetical protein Bpfe_001371 [Biomphalaria pfeifferi]
MFTMMKLWSFLLTWTLFLNAQGSLTLRHFNLTVTGGNNSYSQDLRQSETTPIYVNRYDAVNLTCSVSGQSFNSALLFEKTDLQNKTTKTNHTENVTIHYIKHSMDCSDAGKYTCRAGHLEWSRTIIVRCPPPVFTFKSPSVNIKKNWNLKLSCELISSEVSIQTMDKKDLTLCYTSPCEYTFKHVTCEAMGTYYCGSKPGDVIVFNCPPQLMKSDQTVRVELGDSVNVSVDVLLALNHQLTVLYQKQNVLNKCGTKLCLQTSETMNKWRQQIKIVINNITTQDMGNLTFTMCSNFKAESFCTNMTITILPLHEPVYSATPRDAKSTNGRPYSDNPDFPILPVTLACSFVVTTVVLATVFFKLKGKQLLIAQLKERSQSLNRPAEGYTPDTGSTSTTYMPHLTDTMNHHSTLTENGQTMTTAGLTFLTVGNTEVIKKTERTIIEEVRETVEIVHLDSKGMNTDQEHPVKEESDLQEHTYSNINFVPS